MLPATLQLLIVMIASSISERMQKRLDCKTEEVLVLKEILNALTGKGRIEFNDSQRQRLATKGKELSDSRRVKFTSQAFAFTAEFKAILKPASFVASDGVITKESAARSSTPSPLMTTTQMARSEVDRDSADCSTSTIVKPHSKDRRVLGHYGISHYVTPCTVRLT